MPQLRRKAYLLCGDWHAADDLVQETLVTMYQRWDRLIARGNVEAYADRVLFTRHIDATRRPWRRERAAETLPERADDDARRALSAVEAYDEVLTAALAQLPAKQRSVVVLTFVEDLSIPQVAALLDLPVGTVKSRLSRGTARLRTLLAIPPDRDPPAQVSAGIPTRTEAST